MLSPYHLGLTAGSSSGGTDAALTANFGLVGTGSDTGQSTGPPASANRWFGIGLTRGLP